jgi:hypothetical protein
VCGSRVVFTSRFPFAGFRREEAMQGELGRIFALASLGVLIVLYGAIEGCIWVSRRVSGALVSAQAREP